MTQTKRLVVYFGNNPERIETVLEALEIRGMDVRKFSSQQASEVKNLNQQLAIILIEFNSNDRNYELLSSLNINTYTDAPPILAVVESEAEVAEVIKRERFLDFLLTNDDTATNTQKILSYIQRDNSLIGIGDIDISSHEFELSHSGIRVFIVEDDPLLKNLLGIRFDRASFPYEFNTNGIGVIPALKRFRPYIIILDLMLPGISGFTILEDIKREDELRNIPVIIFSNRDSYSDKERAKELGAVGFYVKAMTDLSELVATIERVASEPGSKHP